MEHPITNLCKNRVISEKGQPMLCRRTTVQWLRRSPIGKINGRTLVCF